MKKITAIILFIGCCIGILISLYGIFETIQYESESALLIALILIPLASGIYYTVVTKFGSSTPTILDSLERENEIIKKQIEKKELLSKLKSLDEDEQ